MWLLSSKKKSILENAFSQRRKFRIYNADELISKVLSRPFISHQQCWEIHIKRDVVTVIRTKVTFIGYAYFCF